MLECIAQDKLIQNPTLRQAPGQRLSHSRDVTFGIVREVIPRH